MLAGKTYFQSFFVILCRWFLSISPENIRKPFSEAKERDQWREVC